jgi:hypothetical protein
MQPVAELASTPEGHLLLVLRGEEGAVSVEAWRDPGSGLVVGMLTVHSLVPHAVRCEPESCDFLGLCYPVFADWTTNFTAAEYLVRGGKHAQRAERIAAAWYLTHLCPDGVPS